MLQQELAPCACGSRGGGGCSGRCAASPAFSLLFPVPMGLPAEQCYSYTYHEDDGGSPYDAAGAPVDCTLSLGTPSTRRAEAGGVVRARAGGGGAAALMEEPRQEGSPPRRCANCDTASTPLWRNGPRGPKSLCNACGIRYKKEERRAAAAMAPAPAPAPATQDSGARPYACGGYARRPSPPQQQQRGCYGPAAGKGKSAASYRMYGCDVGVVDAAAAVDGPCLSWMLNVVPSSPAFAVRERHTLFQYYWQH